MSRLFKVWPKRSRNTNNVRISPEMELIVTTKSHASTPFYNGAVELKAAYLDKYGVDIKKGNFSVNDFEIETLD